MERTNGSQNVVSVEQQLQWFDMMLTHEQKSDIVRHSNDVRPKDKPGSADCIKRVARNMISNL